MNPFADMEHDTVVVERDGAEVARYKCCFVQPKLTIMGDDVDILEGDKLFQLLPNGKRVEFDVEDVSYQSGLDDMCGCVFVALEKVRAKPKPVAASTTNHITIQNAQGIQIGDNNVQQLTSAIEKLVATLNAMHAPEAEKSEATNKLREILENPLVQKAARIALSSLF